MTAYIRTHTQRARTHVNLGARYYKIGALLMKFRRELSPLQDTGGVVFAADVSSAKISGFN